jgi:hypothetical protein
MISVCVARQFGTLRPLVQLSASEKEHAIVIMRHQTLDLAELLSDVQRQLPQAARDALMRRHIGVEVAIARIIA